MRLLRRILFFIVALFGCSALAQSTGSISGVVSDLATRTYLVGAEVRIAGTPLATATGRDGSFALNNVPAGTQTLEVTYLGRKAKTVTVEVRPGTPATARIELADTDVLMLEKVTVESVREGQSRAINQQRTSNTISSIISSDAIGNLPDQTVGDALARLAGVSVVLDGRSAFASIRGAEAKLNSVTLDGSHISSPANDGIFTVGGTETRAVDVSTIPSDLIGSIEVIKALPADRDADSFGGLVNLVTRSAFDLPGRSINGKAEYRYNSLRKDDGYAFNFNYSDVNASRTLGVTASVSYSKEKYGQQDYEIAYFDKSIAPVDTIAGITNQAISEFDQRFRRVDRENLGGNLNFDYRPGDTSQFFLKLFHNGSDTDMKRWRLRERGFNRLAASSTDRLATGTEMRFTRRLDNILTDRNNNRISLGGKTKLPTGTLDYEVNYGDAKMEAHARRYQFETASTALRRVLNWTVDRADPEFPLITVVHTNGQNGVLQTQDMALNQLRFQNVTGKDKDVVARLDYQFDHKLGSIPVQWKFGAKQRSKDRTLDGAIDDYLPTATGVAQSTFTTEFEPRKVFDGRVATLGPFPKLDDVFTYRLLNPNSFTLSNGDESAIVAISRYSASEDITAFYGMGTATIEKLQVVGGLRYENTSVDYTYRPSATTTATGSSTYGDLFPSVLLNYRFNRDVVLRGGWTNTLSRPDYGDLVPYESSLDPEGVLNLDSGALARVYKGNPNLKAQKAMNFDVSLEWYYQPTGMLSVAVFKKQISDFIYKGVSRESRPPIIVALYQNLNGADQDINGTELTWVQSLSMLPAPLDGFGFSANATFISGESTFPTLNVTTGVAGTRKESFVPSQPKRVFNAQVYWEKYGFTARLAMNYIDDFVREVGGLAGEVINNPATRWDAQVSYRINKNFTVYVEGKNLTSETKRWYNTTPNRPEEYELGGWNASGGVRFRF